MKLEEIKNIGGIGSILLLSGIIPVVGQVLVFAGFVMVIIAVYQISYFYSQKEIFRDYLIGIILGMVAFLVMTVGIMATIITSIEGGVTSLKTGIIVTFLLIWLLSIIAALFINKSFKKIGEATQINAFKTAGKLYLIGSILLIVIIGWAFLLIAAIMQIIAFFSLSPSSEQKRLK